MKLTIDFNVNVSLTGDVAERLVGRLGLILAAINAQNGTLTDMTASLDHLSAEVAETKDVMASAAALIAGMADQIRALKDDPAALEALATDLDTAQNALAAAVAANTPAAPVEDPAPVEEPAPIEETPADDGAAE